MYRRLYFLFSERRDVERIVAELAGRGVPRGRLHTLARDGTDTAGLPGATPRQRRDAGRRLERSLWNANLGLFAVALPGLAAALWAGAQAWAAVALGVLVASFVAGAAFALRVPDTHLEEFREALRHGDILLMVDVPARRVAEIEDFVHRRHPEAVVGGVGWTLNRFGI